jgi:hypothetical protein
MLREARSRNRTPRRSAPSLARTVQALRAIRGQESRTAPEMRVIAIRLEKQLA